MVTVSAIILDGTATAAAIKADLTERVGKLAAAGMTPGLGTVLVGDDPASRAYVAGKHRDCAEVGISSIRRDLPATATQDEVDGAVAELNADQNCTGYLVQLPLPAGLDEQRVLEVVDLLEELRRELAPAVDGVATPRAVPDVPLVERQPEALARPAQPLHVIADRRHLADLPIHIEVHRQKARRAVAGLGSLPLRADEARRAAARG